MIKDFLLCLPLLQIILRWFEILFRRERKAAEKNKNTDKRKKSDETVSCCFLCVVLFAKPL